MPSLPAGRARVAVAAVFMQVLLGVLYSWSVFRGPLSQLHGWTKAETIAPYRYSILFFAIGMIAAGYWQDRKGPRLVASCGGLLLAAGCLIAALLGNDVWGLVLGYGVVAGLGVGFAYVTPIAACLKWFPDNRGMIVGLVVMGFGAGPLVFAPLLERLIGADPARLAETIPRTFLILAGIFLVGVIGAAQFYRVPPPGWTPPGWTPPPGRKLGAELAPRQMLARPQFYGLWLVFFLGTSVGLTAIGEATPLLREMASASNVLSAGAALGVMSVFNGVGRLAWGSLSDRLGRKPALIAMFAVSACACVALLFLDPGFWTLLGGLSVATFAYGGYLAILPSLTADYFGPRHVGANYGFVFSAWGACGFLVPGYFAAIMDRARLAGDLAAGYHQIYWQLAVLAAAGAAVAALLRPPAGQAPPAR